MKFDWAHKNNPYLNPEILHETIFTRFPNIESESATHIIVTHIEHISLIGNFWTKQMVPPIGSIILVLTPSPNHRSI